MKTSTSQKVAGLYEETADAYSQMMDAEIDTPIYSEILDRLADRITGLSGPLFDTSCGSGHMLEKYHDQHDPQRQLIGQDLSPRMVQIARERIGTNGDIRIGDMRKMQGVEPGSVAAVLSFFAIHHLDPQEVADIFRQWHRILASNGQLFIAAWEGTGKIDYNGETEVIALRYREEEVHSWAKEAGFAVDRCEVKPVDEMPMDAIYLEATRD